MGYTIQGVGGGSGLAGHTVADEGGALAQRATLDFAGGGVTVTDVPGSNKTLVTVPTPEAPDPDTLVAAWAVFKGNEVVPSTFTNAAVSVADDTITLASHGITTGQRVCFVKLSGTTYPQAAGAISFAWPQTWFARATAPEGGTGLIALYDTEAHANAGGATGRIDITNAGSGTFYILPACTLHAGNGVDYILRSDRLNAGAIARGNYTVFFTTPFSSAYYAIAGSTKFPASGGTYDFASDLGSDPDFTQTTTRARVVATHANISGLFKGYDVEQVTLLAVGT